MTYKEGFQPGETKDFVLGYGRKGRYLYVKQMDLAYLSLCEVEVFATRRKSMQFSSFNKIQCSLQNKDILYNTIATVSLIDTSIQSD